MQAERQARRGQAPHRGEQEEDVQVGPRLAGQDEVGGDERGELAGQHGGQTEAQAARGGEGGQVERPRGARGQPDRQVEGRDVVARPEKGGEDRVERDRPEAVRRHEEPGQRHGRDAERAEDHDRSGADPVDRVAPEPGRGDAHHGHADAVGGHHQEAGVEVRQHVIGEEAGRDAHRRVPGEEVTEEGARDDRGPRARASATRTRRARRRRRAARAAGASAPR